MIDVKLLSAGDEYKKLPELMMIWILPYDLCGENRMIYTIKNMVVENPKLVYNDGVEKIFVYTRGTVGGSPKLKELLRYLEETIPENAVDEDLREMQNIVGKIKHRKDVGKHYMTLQEIIDQEKKYSLEIGRREGIEAGIRMLKELNHSKEEACRAVTKQFQLTEDEAKEYLKHYW